MTRLTHDHWMQQALTLALQANLAGEVPVAAVVIDAQQQQIAAAHNLTRQRPDATAHAEILAIAQACAFLQQPRLPECTLYVTLEPCAMCAGAIVQARLARVVFAAYDPKMGAIEHGVRLFTSPNVNHRPEVIAGVGETQAKQLLRTFFSTRR